MIDHIRVTSSRKLTRASTAARNGILMQKLMQKQLSAMAESISGGTEPRDGPGKSNNVTDHCASLQLPAMQTFICWNFQM